MKSQIVWYQKQKHGHIASQTKKVTLNFITRTNRTPHVNSFLYKTSCADMYDLRCSCSSEAFLGRNNLDLINIENNKWEEFTDYNVNSL